MKILFFRASSLIKEYKLLYDMRIIFISILFFSSKTEGDYGSYTIVERLVLLGWIKLEMTTAL